MRLLAVYAAVNPDKLDPQKQNLWMKVSQVMFLRSSSTDGGVAFSASWTLFSLLLDRPLVQLLACPRMCVYVLAVGQAGCGGHAGRHQPGVPWCAHQQGLCLGHLTHLWRTKGVAVALTLCRCPDGFPFMSRFRSLMRHRLVMKGRSVVAFWPESVSVLIPGFGSCPQDQVIRGGV